MENYGNLNCVHQFIRLRFKFVSYLPILFKLKNKNMQMHIISGSN